LVVFYQEILPGYDRAASGQSGEVPMPPLSEFNTVLNQVLALTDATTTECGLLPPDSAERYRCEGKLVALHQVIEFFLAIDRKKFAAKA
jgi:hypothetical protein